MGTTKSLTGGEVRKVAAVEASEYLPNRGVFLAGLLGRDQGHAYGLYHGTMEPGAAIARELHPETSETVYVLSGRARGHVGDGSVELGPGEVLHVHANVPHGLENIGDGVLEFLVIGHPDF